MSHTASSGERPRASPSPEPDQVTGKPLFTAGKERSWDAFVKESKSHGWPSFRDSEVKPRLFALAPILPLVLALSPTSVRASEVS